MSLYLMTIYYWIKQGIDARQCSVLNAISSNVAMHASIQASVSHAPSTRAFTSRAGGTRLLPLLEALKLCVARCCSSSCFLHETHVLFRVVHTHNNPCDLSLHLFAWRLAHGHCSHVFVNISDAVVQRDVYLYIADDNEQKTKKLELFLFP